MADHLPQVNFSDGEGIDEEDFNRLQSLIDAKINERAFRVGGLAGAFIVDKSSSGNPNGPLSDARPESLSSSRLITPDPLTFSQSNFDVDGSGNLSIDTGKMLLVQRAGAAAGTPPAGFAESFGGILSYVPDDGEIAVSAIARPTVNPRWDSLNLALGHAVGGSESRDFEDSATRALTSATTSKDQDRTLLQELQQGLESATPVYPTPTAGYAPYITILRDTAETALDEDSVRLHSFPPKLRIERVHGFQAYNRSPSLFAADFLSTGAISRTIEDIGSGDLVFFPRNLHSGCRLVGFGASFYDFTLPVDVNLIRVDDSTGSMGSTTILESSMQTDDNGYAFYGLPNLLDGDGNELPIWGNGRTYGPLFSGKERAPLVFGGNSGSVAISIEHTSFWRAGDTVNYVDFYYLE